MSKTKTACKILKDALSEFIGKRAKQSTCYERNEHESFAEFVVDLRGIDLDEMVDAMQLALEHTESYMDVLLFDDGEIEELDEKAMKNARVTFCILWYATTED